MHDFFEYFKNLNFQDSASNNEQNFEQTETSNQEINGKITEDEIVNAVKNLKNNKASGYDQVLNEHIKSTMPIMLNIYEKLFNLILDTGCFPSSWTTGIIKPVYKNKGNKPEPQNFRPITLVSCFSKLFTSILINRLNTYVTESFILKRNQAGFRKNFSTVDNIFIMDSLIRILNNCRRKVYSAFVDFKSAFDTVWRAGLWKKLINSNIDGKVLEQSRICIQTLSHVCL